MRQIRRGVFETNSSSVHSITMCMKNEYDDWKNGKVYLNDGWWTGNQSMYTNKNFVTREEALDLIRNSKYYNDEDYYAMDEDEFEEFLESFEIYTLNRYNDREFECFKSEYTTPNGESVVSFGYYGSDY